VNPRLVSDREVPVGGEHDNRVGANGARAVMGFPFRQVAIQCRPGNLRVNPVHPGCIKTPMVVAATGGTDGGIAAQVRCAVWPAGGK
jgi:NAD(P)-dependent dehydrogenase (short-subunit alcohol dehydrogenase family)